MSVTWMPISPKFRRTDMSAITVCRNAPLARQDKQGSGQMPTLKSDSQFQDRDSHGPLPWRLLRALGDIKAAAQVNAALVKGTLIFPDTEEATSSSLVPPTVKAQVRRPGPSLR